MREIRVYWFWAISVFCIGIFNFATIRQSDAASTSLVAVPTEAVGARASLDLTNASPPPQTLSLTFALNSTAATTAPAYISSLNDPNSPNYHHWLTPTEYGDKFGADNDDITAVVRYLASHGFSSIKVWKDRLFVSAQIPTTDAESLFNASLNSYVRSADEVAKGFSRTYYAPANEPTVDSSVAGRLHGIFGLSDIGERRPYVHTEQLTAINTDGALDPYDLAQIYNGAALQTAGCTGTGVTVAIFSPTTYSTSDVDKFLSANDISSSNITVVNVDGGTTDNSNELEADLDIETVVGQASGATIHVYEGPNDGSLNIFNQMAEDMPNIVTESYGTDEDQVTKTFADSYDTLREQMAGEGITIVVASGDTGAYDAINLRTVTISVDASSAYVTSVGGTELDAATNDVWDGEVAWTYNDGTLGSDSGSGGGLSQYYTEPTWQQGPGVANAYSNGMRQIPDISTLASTPFYNICYHGQFSTYGGTSCGCQFFGGSLALIEQALGTKLGLINPQLYTCGSTNSAIYHDITSGNNGVYPCTTGWDLVTGWGSPDIAKLALALQGTNTSSSPIHSFSPGLQMFSVPFTFAASDTAGELLNGLVTPSGPSAYDVAVWQPSTFSYAISPATPANTFAPGSGYWGRFDPNNGGSLTAIGSPVTSTTFAVNLSPGWNMIGDPYATNIPISSLTFTTGAGTVNFADAVSAGVIQADLYDYNGSVYVAHTAGDTLNSYDGYWIYCYGSTKITYTEQL